MGAIELIDVKPLPIPAHPYTRKEIENYAWHFLNGEREEGILAEHDRKNEKIQRRFIKYFETLPPWIQVLLVENRVPLQVMPQEKLAMPSEVFGQAVPDTYRIDLPESLLRSRADWFEHCLSHEIGHLIDNMLGNSLALGHDNKSIVYFTGIEPRWTRLLMQELDTPSNGTIVDLGGGQDVNQDLRGVLKKYSKMEYPREAFGVLVSYYLTSNFRFRTGSKLNKTISQESDIDTRLEKFFPRIWPYFREEIEPLAMGMAGELYARGQERKEIANQYRLNKMQTALEKAVKFNGCREPKDPRFAEKLVDKHVYYTNFQDLFEVISGPVEGSASVRLKKLFPGIFEPLWGASEIKHGEKLRRYTLHEFPRMRNDLIHFALNYDTILRRDGIESFTKQYLTLWVEMENVVTRREAAPAR